MEDYEREFVAYSRKLLRALESVKISILSDNQNEAVKLLDELITDTKGDIEL